MASSAALPSTGAMAILDKYATLNRHLDEARQETLEIQDRVDNATVWLEDTHQERAKITDDRGEAQHDTRQLQKELDQISRQHRQHIAALPHVDPRGTVSLRLIQEHRQEFLAQSRQFRRTVQRLRLTATELGLDMAAPHAWLELHGVHVQEDASGPAEELVSIDLLEEEWHQEAMEEDTNGRPHRHGGFLLTDDHGTSGDKQDLETERALDAYHHAWTKHAATTTMLENTRVASDKSQQRSRERLGRQDQLRAQLDRIQRDTSTLEEQLAELETDTQMALGMAKSFRQRAEQRAASRPQNPYAGRTPPSAPRTYPVATVSDDRQHPHFEGHHRRYVDRQFNTSVTLEVNDDSDDDILSFAPFQKKY
jgi:hypothetical protein